MRTFSKGYTSRLEPGGWETSCWLNLDVALVNSRCVDLGRGSGRVPQAPVRKLSSHLEETDELCEADPEEARDVVDRRAADLPRVMVDRDFLDQVACVMGS